MTHWETSVFRHRPQLRCFSEELRTERRRKRCCEIMTPPKRKTRGQFRKERIIVPSYSRRQHRKRPDIQRRVQTHQPISVREMVYRLLNVDKHNQGQRESRVSRSGKMRKYQNAREASYDSSTHRDSSASIEESEYTKSAATSVENLPGVMDAANSSGASYSENSSVSNICVEPIALAKSIDNTRALLKKKSLVQVINNYIKAGIEEGKRQAKKYIRKALSFGVKSGYLIPTDPQGQVIRVSPTLIESKRSDEEARKRRRRARKGEDDPFADGKEHRRPTPPWGAKKHPRREDTPKPETPPRKRKKALDSKNADTIQTKKTTRRKHVNRNKRTMKRKPMGGKRNSLVLSTLPNQSFQRASNKSEECLKQPKRMQSTHEHDVIDKKNEHRSRRTKSPGRRKNQEESFGKSPRHSSGEDEGITKYSESEVDERASIGQRKSTTSREDAARSNNASIGNATKEIEEQLNSLNRENNENNL